MPGLSVSSIFFSRFMAVYSLLKDHVPTSQEKGRGSSINFLNRVPTNYCFKNFPPSLIIRDFQDEKMFPLWEMID